MDPSLYVVLDRTAARGRDLVGLLAQALAGGSRMIQLRDKDWPSGRLLPLAEKLRAACAAAGATFIVNDRVDLALAVGADGVHLGQDDLPARAARPLLRPGMILGISTHSVEQARAAQADGADYVAVGSMFATTSKADFQLVGRRSRLAPESVADALPVTSSAAWSSSLESGTASRIRFHVSMHGLDTFAKLLRQPKVIRPLVAEGSGADRR